MSSIWPARAEHVVRRAIPDQVLYTAATVTEVEPIAAHTTRVRLAADGMADLSWQPGQWIRLQVAGLASSLLRLRVGDAFRTYSVYDGDRSRGWIDLAVYAPPEHAGEHGPGASWIRSVAPGERTGFFGPIGGFVVDPGAAHHLFLGDETAAPSFAPMLGALPAGAAVRGVIEAGAPDGHIALPRPLRTVERGARAAGDPAVLLEAVREEDLPSEPGTAYLAGEARTIQALRRHLVEERGWPRRAVRTKPYWTPGRRGME